MKPFYRTISVLTLSAIAASFTGCGSEKPEEVAKEAKEEAKQDYAKTENAVSKMADEATEGAKTAAKTVETKAVEVKEEAEKTMATAVNHVEPTKPAVPETKAPVASSMSSLQQQLTEQLGTQAAAQLESSLDSLKRQATDAVVKSSVDSLSSSLAKGDVNGSLSSLTALSALSGKDGINPITLKDTVSLSSASILADAFSGGSTPTPSIIDTAINKFKGTDLLGGATNLVKSLGSTDMSASQKGIVDQVIDASLPLLGETGTQLQQLREQGSQLMDAGSAIKNLF
ncbi:hypothetical protein [Cerasicoccus arenae]|uniref:Lipoprotein n=1 Tax=Cerasicoccus arenae TaxID=424488 RepID=A0A8J3DB50_9BACT|nr:hypothetical protein [Cerasicoccus arenae]MBK1857942.1 hypothetical protein [Cerasicoccus arenae]GHB97920.1 hypothetical protein GCM10007047_12310 [Cerasicoccus arenae]